MMEKILVKSHGKCPKLPWMIDFHSTEDGKTPNCQLQAAYANNYFEYMSLLNIKSNVARERLTQLICNVTEDVNVEELLEAGMSVAKLNMADFETEEDCEEKIRIIRQLAENYSKKIRRIYPLAIALEIDAPMVDDMKDDTASEIARDIIKCLILRTIPSYQISTHFVIRQKIDVIFLTKITDGAKSVQEMKKVLNEEDTISTLIFSTIETPRNVDEIDEIIKESDGIIIDINQLLDSLQQKFFLSQKSIIAKCNIAGKPVIGVIDCSELKKSEICDISTMIIDGIDGILTQNPSSNLLNYLSLLCKEAEAAVYQKQVFNYLSTQQYPNEPIYSLAISAVESAIKTNAAAIIVLTTSGRSAKIISRYRPRCPIIAITRYVRVARQLHMYRGVIPIFYVKKFCEPWVQDVGERVQLGITFGKYQGFIRMGDTLVILTGSRAGSGFTNNMKIVYASEHDTRPYQQNIVNCINNFQLPSCL